LACIHPQLGFGVSCEAKDEHNLFGEGCAGEQSQVVEDSVSEQFGILFGTIPGLCQVDTVQPQKVTPPNLYTTCCLCTCVSNLQTVAPLSSWCLRNAAVHLAQLDPNCHPDHHHELSPGLLQINVSTKYGCTKEQIRRWPMPLISSGSGDGKA